MAFVVVRADRTTTNKLLERRCRPALPPMCYVLLCVMCYYVLCAMYDVLCTPYYLLQHRALVCTAHIRLRMGIELPYRSVAESLGKMPGLQTGSVSG